MLIYANCISSVKSETNKLNLFIYFFNRFFFFFPLKHLDFLNGSFLFSFLLPACNCFMQSTFLFHEAPQSSDIVPTHEAFYLVQPLPYLTLISSFKEACFCFGMLRGCV